jgi:hypothetical protein
MITLAMEKLKYAPPPPSPPFTPLTLAPPDTRARRPSSGPTPSRWL